MDATRPEVTDGNVRIEVAERDAVPAVRDRVMAGLTEYNDQHVPSPNMTPLVLAARDKDDQIVGGLVGVTPWAAIGKGWLYVHMLWVTAAWRKRGLGRRLLRAAEAEAVRHGCRSAYLDTFEFQARAFYEREGYVTFGVLEGFPPGWRRYSMRKELRSPAAGEAPDVGSY